MKSKNYKLLRTAFKILIITLINVSMIWLSFVILKQFIQILNVTNIYEEYLLFFFIIFLIFFLVTLAVNPGLIKYWIGTTSLSIACLLYGVFFLNQHLTLKSDYHAHRLTEAVEIDSNCYMRFYIENFSRHRIATKYEYCLNVDSFHIRINRGIFGMQVFTDDVKILPSDYCENYLDFQIDNSDAIEPLANDLVKKRCFDDALKLFSLCIDNDPENVNCLKNRGYIYLYNRDYNNAMNDFLQLTHITMDKLNFEVSKLLEDEEDIEWLSFDDVESPEEFIELFQNPEFMKEFANQIHIFFNYLKLSKYFELYEYCYNKMNQSHAQTTASNVPPSCFSRFF